MFLRQRIEPVDPGDVVAGVEIGGGKVAQRRELRDEVREEIGERCGKIAKPLPWRGGVGVGLPPKRR